VSRHPTNAGKPEHLQFLHLINKKGADGAFFYQSDQSVDSLVEGWGARAKSSLIS